MVQRKQLVRKALARPDRSPPMGGSQYLGLLAGLALLLGLYTLLRFAGQLGETDTNAFTHATRAVLNTGLLAPPGRSYPNGYGYQTLLASLVQVTDLPLGVLQVAGGALLAVWIVVPAWLAYREFTGGERAAVLATLILLAQPEFLFPLLRGTHEKFTRGLMFLCLYLMLRSLRAKGPRQAAGFVIAFYLCAYALITFNNLLATSFIAAVFLALALLWFSKRTTGADWSTHSPLLQRLVYVILSLLLIAFIFTFYTYPPAMHQLRILQSIGDRLALLFLQVEEVSTNPYETINQGWISLPIYILVSIGNWLLLAFSALVWLWQSWRWWVKGENPGRNATLLWAFYAAFALQGILSALVDISGAIAGNLQHRIFPSFAMIAAPLVAAWIDRILAGKPRPLLRRAFALGLGLILLLAVFKATNEPVVSNYWTFYTTAESQAVDWAEAGLFERTLWTGFNDRVSSGKIIRAGSHQSPVELDPYLPELHTKDFLVSESMLLQSVRLKSALPIQADSLVTYDNGEAQIYHLRPRTPFQR